MASPAEKDQRFLLHNALKLLINLNPALSVFWGLFLILQGVKMEAYYFCPIQYSVILSGALHVTFLIFKDCCLRFYFCWSYKKNLSMSVSPFREKKQYYSNVIGQEQKLLVTHIWGILVILVDTLNDTKVNIICNLRQMVIRVKINCISSCNIMIF